MKNITHVTMLDGTAQELEWALEVTSFMFFGKTVEQVYVDGYFARGKAEAEREHTPDSLRATQMEDTKEVYENR